MSRVVALERPKEPLSVLTRAPAPPGPGEVLLRVEACALGQWDWNLLTLDVPPRLPLIPGVEAVGVVEAGAALPLGARVLVTPLASSCGQCDSCRSGEARWCAAARFVGTHFDGALGTHVTLPAQHLAPAPALPAAVAACLGGSAWTAVGAVRTTKLSAGARLGVFGVGGVGHLAVQVALARGLSVMAEDHDPQRTALGAALGARPLEGSLDAAVVCTPSMQALQRAVKAVRAGGVVVVVGSSPTGRIDLLLADVVARGVTVVGSVLGSSQDLAEALALASSGALKPVVNAAPLDAAAQRLWWLRDGGFTGRLIFTP